MSLSRPKPTWTSRLPWIAVVIGALGLPTARALIPSPTANRPIHLDLPVDGSKDTALLQTIVSHSATQPGSSITDMRWTGSALEVDVQIDSPRVIVMVDDHGHTSVERLARSGTAVLNVAADLTPAPPFNVIVLAARGPSYLMQDKANVDTISLGSDRSGNR